jgi:hypothetical protein
MTLQDVKHSEQDIIVRTLAQDGNQDTGHVEHGKCKLIKLILIGEFFFVMDIY